MRTSDYIRAANAIRIELRQIEARHYSEPLDYTRAAVARAAIRSLEIDAANEDRR